MHSVRFPLSPVQKRATSTLAACSPCGNQRDMATARGRKAVPELGLAQRAKTFRVGAYYTTTGGKTTNGFLWLPSLDFHGQSLT